MRRACRVRSNVGLGSQPRHNHTSPSFPWACCCCCCFGKTSGDERLRVQQWVVVDASRTALFVQVLDGARGRRLVFLARRRAVRLLSTRTILHLSLLALPASTCSLSLSLFTLSILRIRCHLFTLFFLRIRCHLSTPSVSNRPHATTPNLSHGRFLSCGLLFLCCLFLRHVGLFSSHHGAVRDAKDLDVPTLFNYRRSNVVNVPPLSSPLSIRASLDLSRTMMIARHDPPFGFLTSPTPCSPPSLPLLRPLSFPSTSHATSFSLCLSSSWMHCLLSRHESCACLCL